MFCSPLLFRGRHLCTNAYGIHWMIGAIFVKFSQLILTKIIKIVATRCQILRLKCTKFNFETLLGKLTALPRPLAGFKGPTSKGREEKGGSGGKGGVPSTFSADVRPCQWPSLRVISLKTVAFGDNCVKFTKAIDPSISATKT